MALNCLATAPLSNAVSALMGTARSRSGHAIAGGEGDLAVFRDADGAAGGVGVEGAEDAIDVGLL